MTGPAAGGAGGPRTREPRAQSEVKEMQDLQIPRPTGHGSNHPVFWPGVCVHCEGDLQLCEDQLGPFRKCITCGRTSPEDMGPVPVQHASAGQGAFAFTY